MKPARILVVDDDLEMRVSLGHLLQSADYDTQLVKSAPEGLAALQENAPDVILSDVRMPDMDGLEFQKRVREISHVPVVLISAHGDIPPCRTGPIALWKNRLSRAGCWAFSRTPSA